MPTRFSAYRDSIRSSLSKWPEFSWLNRFLQTPKQADGDKTSAYVFELIGNRFVASQADDTAASLSQAIDFEVQGSRLRVLLVVHGESWDVDRDIVDLVCSKYSIDPRFVARHFGYPRNQWEKNCPGDLRHAIQEYDLYSTGECSWDLGGDVMSSLSMQLGSCFYFSYENECLSLAVHRERGKVTYIRFSETDKTDYIIGKAVVQYIAGLTACCNADYCRCIAPRQLKFPPFRTDHDWLFRDFRQVVSLRREVEGFLAIFNGEEIDLDSASRQGQEACRLLRELTEDIQALLSHYRAKETSNKSDELGELIQAQTDEAKEAKKTSVKLGYLSQLAYVFLPLQLATSVMGMNLKDFGTGNIELRTFLLMFTTIACLSFVPMLLLMVFKSDSDPSRFSQIRSMFEHSQRAALLFGWFCLFHQQTTNDKLWESGISWDIRCLTGVSQLDRSATRSVWAKRRAEISSALKRGPFTFFARYWQGVLDELFDIIDTPQWGRKDPNLHTA
ncbi:MAG: hypothetical protein Q9191_006706 [Dirinaria sp. TL-2023a]